MDLLQSQMAILNNKVDALQQSVEQLESQTSTILTELQFAKNERSNSQLSAYPNRHSAQSRTLNSEMEHKDVLSDFSYPESDSQSGDRSLSPEVQIQRLTAQLTAAYNRIAALEEQLLAKRIH